VFVKSCEVVRLAPPTIQNCCATESFNGLD
jgi:hypothetical protein